MMYHYVSGAMRMKDMKMITYKKVKVYFEHNNNGRPFGIETYDNGDMVHTTWYTSEKERDFAYELHSGVSKAIEND